MVRFESEEEDGGVSVPQGRRIRGRRPGPGIRTTAYQVTAIQKCPIIPALLKEARLNPGTPPPSATFDVTQFSAKADREGGAVTL